MTGVKFLRIVDKFLPISKHEGIMRCTQYTHRGVLISGCWNREVPLYTEVSSVQGVGIEGFHCIQRCPHFRVLE